MERRAIHLSGRKELGVYLSPVRQELLRTLRLAGKAMTPKALSDAMGISPSSVQYHLKKLLGIGAVEIDHRAIINGITATYYIESPATVHMGMERGDDLREEREALASALVNQVFQGFLQRIREDVKNGVSVEEMREYALLTSGAIRLAPQERAELFDIVGKYLSEHEHPSLPGEEAWEFAVVAYRTEEKR